jgi:hypothetical protein
MAIDMCNLPLKIVTEEDGARMCGIMIKDIASTIRDGLWLLHSNGLPTVLSDVRYGMNSRRHLLVKSISGFDPHETSRPDLTRAPARSKPQLLFSE